MDEDLRRRYHYGVATEGSVTEILFSRSVVLISNDLLTITRRGAEPCCDDAGPEVWSVRLAAGLLPAATRIALHYSTATNAEACSGATKPAGNKERTTVIKNVWQTFIF